MFPEAIPVALQCRLSGTPSDIAGLALKLLLKLSSIFTLKIMVSGTVKDVLSVAASLVVISASIFE